jgi:predicted PurR-regulated permease PerM
MVTGYVNGQLFIATVAALFAMVALLISSTILGVSINAVALASIVGLIGLIPMIGNTIAAIIVIIFCLFVSLPLAIIMAVFFLVYQQVENATLQPYIQSKYNELTPLTVFVAALLGVSIAGFLGALVAIPVAGCLRIILVEYYSDKFAPKKLDKTA